MQPSKECFYKNFYSHIISHKYDLHPATQAITNSCKSLRVNCSVKQLRLKTCCHFIIFLSGS